MIQKYIKIKNFRNIKEVEFSFEKGINIIGGNENGCLAGDSIIRFNRAFVGKEQPLIDMYYRNKGIYYRNGKAWDKNIPTFVRSFKEDIIGLHLIQDIVYNGKKELYKIELENGLFLKATKNHKIMTKRGWVQIKDLIIGSDLIMCDSFKSKKSSNYKKKSIDREIYRIKFHPFAKKVKNKKNNGNVHYYYRLPIHRLIVEANLNNLLYEDFLFIIRNDEEKSKNLKYIDVNLYDIHHIDNNHFNNNIDNLQIVTKKEHKLLHGDKNKYNFNQGIPSYSFLKKVTFVGVDDVYDIICQEPYHNFVANGIVVHNSGKSSIIDILVFSIFNYIPFKLEDCINWNTDLDYFEFEHNFEHLNIDYKVYYKYRKGKGERKLVINNDEKNVLNNSQAVEKLQSIFNPDLLKPSMYYAQKEIGAIEISPSKRREFFKKIFNLDFKNEISNLDIDIKSQETKIVEMDKYIYLLQNKKYELKSLLTLPFDDNIYNEKKLKLNNISEEINNYKQEQLKIQDQINKKQNLEKNIINKKSQIYEINSKLKNNEKLLSQYEGELCLDFNSKINYFQKNLDELNDNSIKQLENDLNNIKIVRLLTFDEQKLNEIVDQYYLLSGKLNQEKNNLDLLKSGICPVCKKDFNSIDMTNQEKEINSLTISINALLEKKNNLIEEKNKYDLAKKENDSNMNKKNIILQKIDKEKQLLQMTRNKLISDIENEKVLIENKKNNIINNIDIYQKAIQENKDNIIIIESELKQFELDLFDIESKLLSITIDDSKIKTLENDYNLLNQEIKNYEKILIINKEYVDINNKVELQKVEDQKELDIKLKEKDKLLEEMEIIKKAKLILQKEFPNFVITTLTKGVQGIMNDFVSKVYKPLDIEIKEEKDSIYILYGVEKGDVSLMSGFEREVSSTGWMVGLSKLQGNDCLILDEIDSAATSENSIELYRMLNDLKSDFQQLILVSHRDDTKQFLLNECNAKLFEMSQGELING